MTAVSPIEELAELAVEIRDQVLADIKDRSGFEQAWDGCDSDTRVEIRNKMLWAIKSRLSQFLDGSDERGSGSYRRILPTETVVPREPTEEMLETLRDRGLVRLGERWKGREIYRAMLSATSTGDGVK